MTNYSICFRLFELLRLLRDSRSGAMPVSDLAQQLGVSERTVKRYASALQKPDGSRDSLVRREVRNGRSWVVLIERVQPTPGELSDFACLSNVLKDVDTDPVDTLWSSRVRRAFVHVPFCPEKYDELHVVQQLTRAAIERRVIRATYGHDQIKRVWMLEPWAIARYLDAHYVVGQSHGQPNEGRAVTWSVQRFLEIKLTDERFEVPDEFDPRDHFRGGVGAVPGCSTERVELLFDQASYRIARDRVWPGQIAWNKDDVGRHVLSLDVTVTFELEAWILSWGAGVEVLRPDHLRDRVFNRLRRAIGTYQLDGDTQPRSPG